MAVGQRDLTVRLLFVFCGRLLSFRVLRTILFVLPDLLCGQIRFRLYLLAFLRHGFRLNRLRTCFTRRSSLSAAKGSSKLKDHIIRNESRPHGQVTVKISIAYLYLCLHGRFTCSGTWLSRFENIRFASTWPPVTKASAAAWSRDPAACAKPIRAAN